MYTSFFKNIYSVQDRNSVAWSKLCDYVDYVNDNGKDEFAPREFLGDTLFSEIHTLPQSISKLKKVKKLWLYGSSLKIIPPEIGQMESLEYFDPYTSPDLHWFPFEITYCSKLIDSRISTRRLYGNYKNRLTFPPLNYNPVRYYGEKVYCSVCKKELSYKETNQLWITLRIGTDNVPLLANLCSKICEESLPKPPKGYVQFPHKGGSKVSQPPDENEMMQIRITEKEKNIDDQSGGLLNETDNRKKEIYLFKVIKKIWEK